MGYSSEQRVTVPTIPAHPGPSQACVPLFISPFGAPSKSYLSAFITYLPKYQRVYLVIDIHGSVQVVKWLSGGHVPDYLGNLLCR